MKVLICGSRDFIDPFRVSLAIDRVVGQLPNGSEVIHGDARGADRMAGAAAVRHGHTERKFPADWEEHGKRAGVIRNLAMLDERPDLVIAFWDGTSPGTKHTLEEAAKRGIPMKVVPTT